MKTEIRDQIREYVQYLDSVQEPVAIHDVMGRNGLDEDPHLLAGDHRGPRGSVWMRGPWPAVVAAVVTTALFGVVALVVGSQSPPSVAPPSSLGGDVGYYVPQYVPDGYSVFEVRAFAGSQVVYLNDDDGHWLPSNGGFAVFNPIVHRAAAPDDPAAHIAMVLNLMPDALEVDVDGRRGVLIETVLSQGDVSTSRVSILAVDDAGGLFEVTALGMTRDLVLAVAEGVERVQFGEFVELGLEIAWDVRATVTHDAFAYQVPAIADSIASELTPAMGVDLFSSMLFHIPDDQTVITTEDGSIVEAETGPPLSRLGYLYLTMSGTPTDEVMLSLEDEPSILGLTLSPGQARARTDQYIQSVRGGLVLSQAPYILQAPKGPSPQFDPSQLGQEIPLIPTSSADVVPRFVTDTDNTHRALATQERPIVLIGTVQEPGTNHDPVTLMVWFSETEGFCYGETSNDAMSSGCGDHPIAQFGVVGESSGSGSDTLTYTVPRDTSIVQIITVEATYWQQPIAGYGIIPYGRAVTRPTEIVAFDMQGQEIARWGIDF